MHSDDYRVLFAPDDPNQNYNVTTNMFYLAFWADGIPPIFILAIGLRWALAMLGSLLNFSLFFVTIRNHILLGTCNMLIALNALFTALFEFSLSPTFAMQLFGARVVTLRICFFVQLLPIILRNMIISTLLMVGVDRLISVLFVIWHRQNGQTKKYGACLLLVCVLHAAFFVVFCAKMAVEMPELRLLCLSSDDAYQGPSELILFLVNTIVFILILACYAFLWLYIKSYAKSEMEALSQRIFKSLAVTASTICLCWLSYNGIQALLPAFSRWIRPRETAFVTFVSSFLPYFAMALNAPFYFYLSTDYRTAFLKTFPFLQGIRLASNIESNFVAFSANKVANQHHRAGGGVHPMGAVTRQLSNNKTPVIPLR